MGIYLVLLLLLLFFKFNFVMYAIFCIKNFNLKFFFFLNKVMLAVG